MCDTLCVLLPEWHADKVQVRGTVVCRQVAYCTWSLGLIRDDAAHKVGLGATQVGHQLIEILLQMQHTGETMRRSTQCHFLNCLNF